MQNQPEQLLVSVRASLKGWRARAESCRLVCEGLPESAAKRVQPAWQELQDHLESFENQVLRLTRQEQVPRRLARQIPAQLEALQSAWLHLRRLISAQHTQV